MGLATIEEFISQPFDYIVVGGGTAGLTVAARLTEDTKIRVGVIEAGSARLDDANILIPGMSASILNNADYDWAFTTTPQEYCNNKIIQQPRGRVLGGTSALNYMMWSQATRRDLDSWAKLGNSGWSWEDLIPYYRKAETYHPPTDAARNIYATEAEFLNASLRGTGGPIHTSFPEKDDFVSSAWTQTCKNAGLNMGKPVSDPRTGSCLGGFNQLKAVDPHTGHRSYSANSYFTPNATRPNLLVLTNALVESVTLDGTGDESTGLIAKGARFIFGDIKYTAQATKEVILSCGTFQSPQILELSGVGSPDIIKNVGLDVKIENSNVGENLQEHVIGLVPYDLTDPELSRGHLPSFMTTANLSLQDIMTDEAFDLSAGGQDGLEHDTEHRIHLESASDPHQAVASLIGCISTIPMKPVFLMVSSLTNPFSRGYVHITSRNPKDPPAINPRYYSNSLDLEIMSRALLRSLDVAAAEPLCNYLKDKGNKQGMTREIMAQFAKETVGTHFHPVGTCAMKPLKIGGVVNERLVVYGTANLRVVDASIFPMHVQGNTMSLTYVIAEKAADLIKADQIRTPEFSTKVP